MLEICIGESAKHHRNVAREVYRVAIEEAKISENEIEAIAISNAPGLAPCLIAGMEFAKKKAKELSRIYGGESAHPTRDSSSNDKKKNTKLQTLAHPHDGKVLENNNSKYSLTQIPIIPVNHCIAHLEIGQSVGASDPVMLYASGANTQIIAFSSGKYRVFGETLDSGIGNFIDTFARHCGIAFPGGPEIEKKALKGKYIELPYSIKGMDVSFSGMLTKLKQLYDKGEKLEDLSFSLQETAFAMLVEAAERALTHTGKKELVLGGGVACNKRLQEMCKIMCKERGAKYYCPPKELLLDNAAMIAYTGELMMKKLVGARVSHPTRAFSSNDKKKNTKLQTLTNPNGGKSIKSTSRSKVDDNYFLKKWDIGKIDIAPRERTDDVEVFWR